MERGQLAKLLGAHAAGAAGVSRSIEDADPARFISAFAQAVADGGDLFLADPSWRAAERARLAQYLGAGASGDRGWLMIPSGGAAR